MHTCFEAGVAVIDITPRLGLALGGGALGAADTVLHRLQAKALSIRCGRSEVVLISCDLLGFDWAYALSVRRSIARAHRVPVRAIMLACTHTHSGPASVPLRNWGQPDRAYRKMLRRKLVEVTRRAIRARRPVLIRSGQALCRGVAVNRVFGKRGPVDHRLGWIRVDDPHGRLVAVVLNYGCHPVNLHRTGLISPDFPYFIQQAMCESIGRSTPVLYLAGAGGDVNPANFDTSDGERRGSAERRRAVASARQTGLRLARCALRNLAHLNLRAEEPILTAEMVNVTVKLQALPSRRWLEKQIPEWKRELAGVRDRSPTNWKYCGVRTRIEWAQEALEAIRARRVRRTMEIPVQVLRIGRIRLIGLPGEPFVEVGKQIRGRSSHTFVVELANGCFGYFPTRPAYARKSYEAIACPRYIGLYSFDPSVGVTLVAGVRRHLSLSPRIR